MCPCPFVVFGALAALAWVLPSRSPRSNVSASGSARVRSSGERPSRPSRPSRPRGWCDRPGAAAGVGRSPYDLHKAEASRLKAVGEMLLLEDHMVNDPCVDCMQKHSIAAGRFMQEAATLEGGELGDLRIAEMIESIRAELGPEEDLRIAARTRAVRKQVQAKLGLSHEHVELVGGKAPEGFVA